MDIAGLSAYAVFFLSLVGIYAIMALGLNMQWGMTGQFNIGIAGFFAVGAYTTAILTTAPAEGRVGGFDLPFGVGLVGSVIACIPVAWLVARITARLRTDYLAIATIGIAEIIRLFFVNEGWLSNGTRGIPGIEKPFGLGNNGYLLIIAAFVAVTWLLVEIARRSPWGRVLRAIRDNEPATAAAGKDIARFRRQAFVTGSCLMALGGGLYAHFVGFVSPEAFRPLYGTFLVWVMLIAGGSGNNLGAMLGALVVWLIWSSTEMIAGLVPTALIGSESAFRVFLIGILLQIILVSRPQGLLPEKRPPMPGEKR
ncbi:MULTISPECIES: branched-chain amino acid ABC transporter permease [Spiribacter]|jgi:branched-chain amino acid transport system permease protein|uniref:Branched-chain amino acid ABC transporter permease n=1 Tax=Spiribacter aquaticus TaxID=1935996 RepID=A0A557RKD9_9GAMM|nr:MULTISPECIES: branched-chain amino acid ABC transporter permease [Spiribacter]PZA01172.1 branched-chain amino acid ABC transporter permease [Gammaproteobacteria bacterium 2W06]AUB77898.1 ABC transporter permease [Spiribacter roseus]KAF0279857.1 ABC transporter permease [Spiribacter roseus]KAF0281687.1 ABC transporter permease [Spiribacter roseus]KAF0283516.1 ABC transporter permease [Spiribacter roseus]